MGVVYGIGNAAESKNLIMPIYDGEIRRCILNAGRRQTSAVILNALSKFTINISANRLTLSPGIVMMNNMVGVLPTAAQFELLNEDDEMLLCVDIYFTVGTIAGSVNHFELIPVYGDIDWDDTTYDTSECTTDGFETPGFWRETIVTWSEADGEYQINLAYLYRPYKSYYAEIVTGTVASGVVAVTQPVDDNSRRIATTQYVINQINKEIAPDTATISPLAGNIRLLRRARYVQANGVYNTTSTAISAAPGIDSFVMPTGFTSTSTVYITFFIQSQTDPSQTHCRVYSLTGTTATYYNATGVLPQGAVTVRYSFGYTTPEY